MIKKTMFAGNFAAEFHLDHKSQPPLYRYAIIQRDTRVLLAWGREDTVPDAMRVALETLERFNEQEKKLDTQSGQLSRSDLEELHARGTWPENQRGSDPGSRYIAVGHRDQDDDQQAMRAAS